jgi:hypothetical protein
MRLERSRLRQTGFASVDRLADDLFELAGDQDVRVIEALAAVLARQRTTTCRDEPGSRLSGLCDAGRFATEASDSDVVVRRAICKRIARRALHGSLVDPTRGATAVHRVDKSPAWSRNLLPIGMFGPFLFYCPRWQAGNWSSPGGRSHKQIDE